MAEPAFLFPMPDLLAVKPVESLENLVQSLVVMGADREQIEIIPVGIFRRYRGVLLGYFPEEGARISEGDSIRLYVAERALADRIPEGFLKPLPEEGRPESVFDTAHGGFTRREDDEPVPDGLPGRGFDPEELFRRRLDGGRQLLRVLDRALRRARRDLALTRQSLQFLGGDARFARRILEFLRLEGLELGDEAALFVASRIAGFLDAVGTLDEAAAFLEELFAIPVRAVEEPAGRIPVPGPLRLKLGGGNARLGRTAMPGAGFPDPRPGVVFKVGPMGAAESGRRYQDRAGHRALQSVIEALVPGSRPSRVEYEVRVSERRMLLGAPEGGLLGRTSYPVAAGNS